MFGKAKMTMYYAEAPCTWRASGSTQESVLRERLEHLASCKTCVTYYAMRMGLHVAPLKELMGSAQEQHETKIRLNNIDAQLKTERHATSALAVTLHNYRAHVGERLDQLTERLDQLTTSIDVIRKRRARRTRR